MTPVRRKKKKKIRKGISKKKVCKFCVTGVDALDYKHSELLLRFVNDRGKIAPRRVSGTCAKHQRMLVKAIKRARYVALVPFSREHWR
jgi:small subunit ribosomal protein S18